MTDEALRNILLEGMVIPAHPLALDARFHLDERRQRALTRYYLDAGAGGLAVGVHTTQFEIHANGMLQPVWALAADEIARHEAAGGKPVIKVAGLVGDTDQAVAEAETARGLGYDVGLLSLASWQGADVDALLAHCRRIAEVIPLFGFYLQPAAGGRLLPLDFWRGFFDIPRVAAVKVAPFNRYQSLDVMRALAESGRQREIALYTGNDDHIVLDLLSSVRFSSAPGEPVIGFSGGLLGQWAVWTKAAVDLFDRIMAVRQSGGSPPDALLIEAMQLTDANAAVFDAANGFRGCIAGIHEVLRRQGLLDHVRCLDPNEALSPGQTEEIERVVAAYPHLTDDAFVHANRDRWLA